MLSVRIKLSKRQVKLLNALQAEKRPQDPRSKRFNKIPKRELKQLERQALIARTSDGMVILPSMSEQALMGQ